MKKIWQNVQRQLWVYAAWLLAMALLWSWGFGLARQVPKAEKVSIFMASYTKSFASYDRLNAAENRPTGIRRVEVNLYSPSDDVFASVLEAIGYTEADILILPESAIAQRAYHYCALDEALLENFREAGYTLGYFREGEATYGLKVYDAQTGDTLFPDLTFVRENREKEDYYLLFNANGIHMGKAEGQDRAAIEVAEKLLTS